MVAYLQNTVSNLSLAALFFSGLLSSDALAQKISAQDRLEIVRQALVELAVSSDMKVSNAAYIDANGVLHESTAFRSDANIRGVRVQEYIRESGALKARLNAEVTPLGVCRADEMPYRKTALLKRDEGLVGAGGVFRLGDHYSSEISQVIYAEISSQLASSGKWVSHREQVASSGYNGLLTHDGSAKARYSFVVHLGSSRGQSDLEAEGAGLIQRVLSVGGYISASLHQKLPEAIASKPWPARTIYYNVAVFDNVTSELVMNSQFRVPYKDVERGYSKSALPKLLKESVRASIAQFISRLEGEIDCSDTRVIVETSNESPELATLTVGSHAGLKTGTQFLIAGSGSLLNDALNSEGLESMALAEVVAVARHSATLKWVAGATFSQGASFGVASYFSGQ